MIRRLLLTIAVLASAATLVVLGTGASGEPQDPRYWVVLDNAFGLIEGADVKVAGVRAGKILRFDVDEETYRARVQFEVKKEGFGELRKDVFCETRPQSLIGEYFLDCLPGRSKERLRPGDTIPVERTGSTVPVDLVTNIMRRPYRERFSLILGELGAGLTARGEDLNETIRRANPALRETDKVLRALAEQRYIIRDLTADADRVVGGLADKRTEVVRFVREARDTSAATAERSDELRDQFRTFPTFLRELTPTMAELGRAADAQRPALETLRDQAPLLKRFLDELGPFSEASRPATRSLAAAARTGRVAARSANPRISELREFTRTLPEVVTNAALVLEHLHNRDFAVEPNKNAPDPKGFTGFEAFLQYVFGQSQAINVYDDNGYMLKVSAFADTACMNYALPENARANPKCRATLGPSQPGIDQPDPTAEGSARNRTTTRRGKVRERERRPARERREPEATRTPAATASPDATSTPAPSSTPSLPLVDGVTETLDELLPDNLAPDLGLDPQDRESILDFLLSD